MFEKWSQVSIVLFLVLTLAAPLFAQDRVYLKNGDRITGVISGKRKENIELRSETFGKLSLDKSDIEKIELSHEQVRLSNGDRITGRLIRETKEKIVLQSQLMGSVSVDRAEINSREQTRKTVEELSEQRLNEISFITSTDEGNEQESPEGQEKENTGEPASSVSNENVKNGENNDSSERKNNRYWTDAWSGELDFGYTLERGNVTSDQFFLQGRTNFDSENIENESKLIYDYATEEGETTSDRAELSNQVNWSLGDRFYILNKSLIGYDRPKGIAATFEEGVGAGYRLIRNEETKLNFESGLNYRFEELTDDSTNREIELRLAETFRHDINDKISVRQSLELFPSVTESGEYIARFDGELRYLITKNMNLKFILMDRYDSNPPADIEPNDLRFITTIGYEF